MIYLVKLIFKWFKIIIPLYIFRSQRFTVNIKSCFLNLRYRKKQRSPDLKPISEKKSDFSRKVTK